MGKLPAPNYTQTPNTLFDLMPEMGEAELRVSLAVCRKTFGWHKDRDRLSLSQLMELTGMSKQGVLNGIEAGISRGWLDKEAEGDSFSYALLVNEVDTPSQPSRQEAVNEVDTQGVNEVDTQKKEYKERIKEISKERATVLPRSVHPVPETDSESFKAVFTSIESAMPHSLNRHECETIRDLWNERPDLDAHHYAFLQTVERADGFNLRYYESCLEGYNGNTRQLSFIEAAAARISRGGP